MSHKIKWMEAGDLPEAVQEMLARFEAVSGLHDSGYTITYYRDDAVFVQVYGRCNLYVVARLLVHSHDAYFELEARAHNYWVLRMYMSEWMMENEVEHRLPAVSEPIPENTMVSANVRVRAT